MKKFLKSFNEFVIIIGIAILIRMFCFETYQINGYSMYNSYYNKEFVIVGKLPYILNIENYKRGDVVVFDTHIEGREFYIKRIIGLPGETLVIKDGYVFIRDKEGKDVKLNEGYLDFVNSGKTYVKGSNEEYTYKIPEGEYFMMGDNRNGSTDSRECFYTCNGNNSNYVKKGDIVGKIFLDLGYFNFSTFNFHQDEKNINSKPKFLNSPSDYTEY